jgi:O-antigen/teichoic acid export membrane protein
MICAISAGVSALAVCAGYLLPLGRWLKVASMSQREFRGVLLLLICYALGSLQTTLTASGFRCDGNYAIAALLLNILKLFEALGVAAAVALGARPVLAAIFLVIVRWGGLVLLCLVMRHRSPWITWGVKHANRASIRQMARPACAFMAFPLGNALSIQGMLVVVGVVLGPLAVTVFSTTRTLTRVGFLILETIKQSIWPEMSAAFGAKNWAYARKLHGKACQVSVLLCAAAVLFLAIFGPRIYVVWTHGSVKFEPTLFYVLLAVIIADSLWSASSVTSLACNAHQRIAAAYLGGTIASLALAYISMSRFGLVGPALALLAIDVPMTRYVLRSSLAILRETPRGFLNELCTTPNLLGLAVQVMGKES